MKEELIGKRCTLKTPYRGYTDGIIAGDALCYRNAMKILVRLESELEIEVWEDEIVID